MFYVGQKVVCVDDGPSQYGRPSGLKAGSIYTVLGCYPQGFVDPRDGLRYSSNSISLHEIGLGRQTEKGEFYDAFCTTRFRPLTDISVFTAMLDRQPSPETEDA